MAGSCTICFLLEYVGGEMDSLISIIVPVYNVEKFLPKCLESIISQSYSNLEIILINDGSQDNSGEICNYYSEKDERIKVIHKENGGVSTARNEGLKIALGDYIGFVDSDDTIEKNMYEVLLEKALENESEIVCCNYKDVLPNCTRNREHKLQKGLYEGINVLHSYFQDSIMGTVIWNKLYKKQIIEGLFFDANYSIAEDTLFNYYAFKKANRVYFTNLALYNAEKRQGSATTSLFNEKFFDARKVRRIIAKDIEDQSIKLKALRALMSTNFSLLNRIIITGKFKEEKRDIVKEIQRHKFLIFQKFGRKTLKLAMMLVSVSPQLYTVLVKVFYKKKGRQGLDKNIGKK